jgi:hypothetical protein
MLQWARRGDALRKYRIERLQWTLLHAAKVWKMTPTELSRIESGMLNNLHWKPPGYTADAEAEIRRFIQ